jgi:hypothetical protein
MRLIEILVIVVDSQADRVTRVRLVTKKNAT